MCEKNLPAIGCGVRAWCRERGADGHRQQQTARKEGGALMHGFDSTG